jgi:hypothetical protein
MTVYEFDIVYECVCVHVSFQECGNVCVHMSVSVCDCD